MVIVPSEEEDRDFLFAMFLQAAFQGKPPDALTCEGVSADPALGMYVRGWGRTGDVAIVARHEAGGERVGAAGYRRFHAADPGYGFVDERTPELTIGVADGWRGRGVGRRLISRLMIEARRSGLAALSLSVGNDNAPARHLYEALGFEPLHVVGGSTTMLVSLIPPGPTASPGA
jgi:ribosomal protein S18 acetylase RimI-like enzyme